jgi:hypothetical protein
MVFKMSHKQYAYYKISKLWQRGQGWLKIIGTVVLLGYLLNRMPIGDVWPLLLQLSPASILSSFLIFLLSNILFALAWAIALHFLGFKLPIQTVSKLFFQSLFISNFASFIGGDSLRVYQVGRSTQRILDATLSVFLTRAVMLYTILLLAGGLTWNWGVEVGWGKRIQQFGSSLTIILLLAIPILGFLSSKTTMISTWPKVKGKSKWISRLIEILGRTHKKLQGHEFALLLILLISLAAQEISAGAVWTLATAMNVPVSWWHLLLFLSIIGIALILPISFNGIGIREVGLVGLLTSIQIDGSQALALSVSTSLLVIVTSFVGGISLLVDFLQKQLQDRK